MNKTMTGMIILGASVALLTPVAPAWAGGGGDDSGNSHSGRGRDHDEDRSKDDSNDDKSSDDNESDDSGNDSPGDDDGTPDQGSGDADGTTDSGDDDGTPDQGRGDRAKNKDDSAKSGRDASRGDRGRSRGKKNRVEVRESGMCSDSSKWRIRIRVRDDRGRIKFQVKTGTVGERWSYSVVDNATEILAGTKVTHGSSADFSVKRKWRGVPAGPHVVTATAENLETGETCSGAATA